MYYDMFVSISPSYLKVQAAEGESLEADYVNALLDYVSHWLVYCYTLYIGWYQTTETMQRSD